MDDSLKQKLRPLLIIGIVMLISLGMIILSSELQKGNLGYKSKASDFACTGGLSLGCSGDSSGGEYDCYLNVDQSVTEWRHKVVVMKPDTGIPAQCDYIPGSEHLISTPDPTEVIDPTPEDTPAPTEDPTPEVEGISTRYLAQASGIMQVSFHCVPGNANFSPGQPYTVIATYNSCTDDYSDSNRYVSGPSYTFGVEEPTTAPTESPSGTVTPGSGTPPISTTPATSGTPALSPTTRISPTRTLSPTRPPTGTLSGTPSCTPKPAMPTGLAPQSTMTAPIASGPNTFRWNSVSGAARYGLRIWDKGTSGQNLPFAYSSGCSASPGSKTTDVCIDSLTTNSYAYTLQPGHIYAWWVHAINTIANNACTQWSDAGTAQIVVISTPLSVSPSAPVTITWPSGSCTKKVQGDADCNGTINIFDFEIWRSEFLGSITTKRADFNGNNRVTLEDFEIWRTSFR